MAPTEASPAPSKRKTLRVAPEDLVPDLSRYTASATQECWYWLGAMPECPVEFVTLAGECFPKLTEDIIRDRSGETQRIPRIGTLAKLSSQKLERIAERLSRTVIRFTEADEGEREEPGTGQNVGDLHRRPRKGFLITIPTNEEVKLREEKGLPVRLYEQRPGDQPAARYLFLHLCEDQTKGGRGESYPHPISVAGLEWPGDDA